MIRREVQQAVCTEQAGTIGVKFSKQFALSKQAQKVKMVATDTAIPNDDEPAQGGNSGDNNGGNQQGGGSQDTGGGLEP